MKLFLASEAKNPATIQKLEKYIGGFKGKSIAYIPTAANGEKWASWKEGGSWNLIQTLGAKISLVQLEDYGSKTVINDLKNIEKISESVKEISIYEGLNGLRSFIKLAQKRLKL